jgi:hypothetical protein
VATGAVAERDPKSQEACNKDEAQKEQAQGKE